MQPCRDWSILETSLSVDRHRNAVNNLGWWWDILTYVCWYCLRKLYGQGSVVECYIRTLSKISTYGNSLLWYPVYYCNLHVHVLRLCCKYVPAILLCSWSIVGAIFGPFWIKDIIRNRVWLLCFLVQNALKFLHTTYWVYIFLQEIRGKKKSVAMIYRTEFMKPKNMLVKCI